MSDVNGSGWSLEDVLRKAMDAPGHERLPLGEDTRRELESIDRVVAEYGPMLEKYGIEGSIDEVAIILPDLETLWGWVSLAVRGRGVTHFNSVNDEVSVRGPIHGHYTTQYEFLELADKPYRIEAMSLRGGFSPLHAAHMDISNNEPVWVHVSFKCHDEEAYGRACDALADTREWMAAQICRSTYGRFTYFAPSPELQDAFGLPALYLKPRVNLRDAQPAQG